MKKPRGIRNNNPLNIRHSASQWQGALDEQKDKKFVQFKTMAYGYRASWKVLESYWKFFTSHKKPFTVENIIRRWAPPKENHTDMYVKSVLRLTSLGGNERLPRPSKHIAIHKLVRLIRAMTTMECGIRYEEVDEISIWEGYSMAYPEDESKPKRKPHKSVPPLLITPYHIPSSQGQNISNWDEYWDWSSQVQHSNE